MKTALSVALAAMFAFAPVSLSLASGNDRKDHGQIEKSERHEPRSHDRNHGSHSGHHGKDAHHGRKHK